MMGLFHNWHQIAKARAGTETMNNKLWSDVLIAPLRSFIGGQTNPSQFNFAAMTLKESIAVLEILF